MIPSLLKNLVPARTDQAKPATPLLFLQRQSGPARSVAPRLNELSGRPHRPRKKRCRACQQMQLPL
jgi:hypothetical protein